ncbi:DUF2207 domain-containing protein [Herbiconiux sp. SALV-R1]|uniref:DUF2207 family protein n=1 Tax=unclassified Herbiconiux TaxID=2618217 RepID=UPI001491AF84|nr:DUF2207 domain-containing protein [Herbiconiux sp. SALV-R1]QJU53742.1 DUF2207 domain-containing protein [Herbiconiux sp. SALV-R1]
MIDASLYLVLAVGGGLAAIVLLVTAWVAARIARRLPPSPVVEFGPPPGELIDHAIAARADRRVLAAGVIDLAVRGRVRVLSSRDSSGPVAIQRVPAAPFSEWESSLFAALVGPDTTGGQRRRRQRALTRLGVSDDNRDVAFLTGPASFPVARARALALLVEERRQLLGRRGLTKGRPVGIHLVLLALAFLAALGVGVVLGLVALVDGLWPITVLVPVVLAALIWVIAVTPPPIQRFTATGNELRQQLSGLRDYLKFAERDRLRMLQGPDTALRDYADRLVLTEKLLPYANVLGEERAWRRELAQLADLQSSDGLIALGTTVDALVTIMDAISTIAALARAAGSVIGAMLRLFD